jgi:hypothetical protein
MMINPNIVEESRAYFMVVIYTIRSIALFLAICILQTRLFLKVGFVS